MTPVIKKRRLYQILHRFTGSMFDILPKPAGREKREGEWGESLFAALSLVKTFFLEVCYYRPSSWVPIQSGACSYKP